MLYNDSSLLDTQITLACVTIVTLRTSCSDLVHGFPGSVASLGIVTDHQRLVSQEGSNLLLVVGVAATNLVMSGYSYIRLKLRCDWSMISLRMKY